MRQDWLPCIQVTVCLLLLAPAGMTRARGEGSSGADSAATQTRDVVAVPDPEQEQAARKAASAWVQIVDRRRPAESREAAGMFFKKSLLRQEWERILEQIRYPMAKMEKRTFDSATIYENHPDFPSERVAFVRYQTQFKNKPDARETVALQLEDGSWKVAGYVIE